MAPTPSSKSYFSTPSLKTVSTHQQTRTPLSKHRLNFTKETANLLQSEHPIEVISRIRDYHEQKNNPALSTPLQLNTDGKSLRVKTEIGYRDFSFDGISHSEEEDLDGFYRKFVESRINGIKLGQKCTIMMYGPTGSGKSHTMFGCSKQPGIVYNALKGILEEDEEKVMGIFVHVTVLEIYNEEVYDLLSCTSKNGGFNFGLNKNGSACKARLEVLGKKAKNANFISGNEAAKIMKEIQKVEKRRIVKNTNCNERSSRSHCMIIIDVPTVGGQLMLVDMAGSENIEQAGQNGGLEAKMQTAKINQGNVALKRVVESIANGDSHVPFRDSKLTMLLQDSFEDDKSKILMILCASPDSKQLHKTIATFEYGAKAKCIVRCTHSPAKDKGAEDSSSSSAMAIIMGSKIAVLDQFICKLQMENKLKEKERIETQKELQRKEEEVFMLRTKLAAAERTGTNEDDINLKVNERTLMLKVELERKIEECQKMANEVEAFRRRLNEIESEVCGSVEAEEGGRFMKRLIETYSEEADMVKSMDLDRSIDMETNVIFKSDVLHHGLSTVYEEDEYEKDNVSDEEVQKEVIEETRTKTDLANSMEHPASSREMRIRNIFTLCGNYRELCQHYSNSSHEAIVEKEEENYDSSNLGKLNKSTATDTAKANPSGGPVAKDSVDACLRRQNPIQRPPFAPLENRLNTSNFLSSKKYEQLLQPLSQLENSEAVV